MIERSKADSGSHVWVTDINEDDKVGGQYLVNSKRVGLTKKGDSFLSITLADRTGVIEARVWDRVEKLSPLFREGDLIDVTGYADSYRNQLQVILTDLKISEGACDPAIFLEVTSRDTTEMIGVLRGVFNSIGNPHIRSLVESFMSDRRFVSLFKKAPAAKNFHHSYLGGLLEHTLSVCQMCQRVVDHYPELDGDLLIAGAFLHDIGKTRELKFERQIDYTVEGRLVGHVSMGVAMVDEKLMDMKDFPPGIALRLKHLILSHHGQYDFGSPKRPKFSEAFALHLIDDLDAKMNGLKLFMEKDRQEGEWTDYHRLFERYFLKSKVRETQEKTVPGHHDEDDKQGVLFK